MSSIADCKVSIFYGCWHNTNSEVYPAEQIALVLIPAKQEHKMGAHITSGSFGNALLHSFLLKWTLQWGILQGLAAFCRKDLAIQDIDCMEKDRFQRAHFEVVKKKNPTYTPNNSSILSFSSLFFFNVFLKNADFSQEIAILEICD